MTKTQNIFEQHLRLAASDTSKEAADHEEPEIDLGLCTDMLHSNLPDEGAIAPKALVFV